MLQMIAIFISFLLIIGGIEEPGLLILGVASLWYFLSRFPEDQKPKLSTVGQTIFNFFIIYILAMIALELKEAKYFLAFFLINQWGMPKKPEKEKGLSWYSKLSFCVFFAMCICAAGQFLFVGGIILAAYWYIFYRYPFVRTFGKTTSFETYAAEGIYYLLMLFCALSALSMNLHSYNYSLLNGWLIFFFFGALTTFTFLDKKRSISCLQKTTESFGEQEPQKPNEEKTQKTSIAKSDKNDKQENKVPIKQPTQPKKPKESVYVKKILNFLSANIANIVLFLGVLFILTAAITFLRSNWETFKYPVFVVFTLMTIGLFTGGYILYRKEHSKKISFLLLILATIFFPLVFYFAVKIGLLADHGNKYIVVWLTTLIACLHAAMFRSVFFSIITLGIFSWANWLTLEKIGIEYEYFAISYSVESIIFFLTAMYYRSKQKVLYWVLGTGANLSLAFTLIMGILFWQAHVFAILMVVGIAQSLLQLRFFINSWTNYYNGILLSSFIIGLVATLGYIADLTIFLMGIPVVCIAFVNINMLKMFDFSIEAESKKAIQYFCFRTPIFVFVCYVIWGGFTFDKGLYSLLAYAVICTIGYLSCFKSFPFSKTIYLATIANIISIWELSKIADIHPHNYTIIFVLWAIAITYLYTKTPLKNYREIVQPLQKISLIVIPLVILYILTQGYEFYYASFFSLSVSLLFLSIFSMYAAYYLKRTDLFITGIVTAISFATLLVHRLEPQFYFIAISVIIFATLGLFASKYFHLFGQDNEQKYKLIFSPIVWTFSVAALAIGFGSDIWQVKIVFVFSTMFFVCCYFLFKRAIDFYFALSNTTIFYTLFFYYSTSFFDWGIYLLPLSIILLFIAIMKKGQEFSLMAFRFAQAIFVTSLVLFLSFIQLQYQQNFWIYPFLLVCASALMVIYDNKTLYVSSLILASYTLYFFCLPKNWFLFQYALFYIPVAIVGIISYYKFTEAKHAALIKKYSHATVMFFLLLPAVLPGMVPSPKISMWVIALAFIFYFVCLYFTRKPLYSYVSTGLFSICLLTALFAVKFLWGNEIALAMSIGSTFLLSMAFFFHKKFQNLAEPVFHIVILNVLAIIGALLFIGKLYYTALSACLICSFLVITIIHISVSIPSKVKDVLAYLSLLLFSASYYLFLEKLDINPNYSSLLVLFLALAFMVNSFVYNKSPYKNVFVRCAMLLPILALTHAHNTANLALLFAIAGTMYGYIAWREKDNSIATLAATTVTIAVYSFLAHISFNHENFMIATIFVSWCWFYLANRLEREEHKKFAVASIAFVALINQIAYYGLYFYNTDPQTYFVAFTCLLNSLVLFFLNVKSQRYIYLAPLSFMFSYYVIIFSWAISVWEFYTIPLGALIIAYAYAMNRNEKFSFFKDLVFVGLLLILLPTFIQSYHGWFNHLYHLGVSPYAHLKHSFFLVIESLILIFYGITRRKLLFFTVGSTFLFSDVGLVLFAYINFGVIPQSIWWATLGVSCITFWILMEYKKEWLAKTKTSIMKTIQNWRRDLKTWD